MSMLSTGALFAEQATRRDPHAVDEGLSFLIAATRSLDPDPHRETV
jgi:hypothetical protein